MSITITQAFTATNNSTHTDYTTTLYVKYARIINLNVNKSKLSSKQTNSTRRLPK